MNDTLIITSPCGTKEWQHQSASVPQIGEEITCRVNGAGILFCGIVERIHREVRVWADSDAAAVGCHAIPGSIVSVWLKPIEIYKALFHMEFVTPFNPYRSLCEKSHKWNIWRGEEVVETLPAGSTGEQAQARADQLNLEHKH